MPSTRVLRSGSGHDLPGRPSWKARRESATWLSQAMSWLTTTRVAPHPPGPSARGLQQGDASLVHACRRFVQEEDGLRIASLEARATLRASPPERAVQDRWAKSRGSKPHQLEAMGNLFLEALPISPRPKPAATFSKTDRGGVGSWRSSVACWAEFEEVGFRRGSTPEGKPPDGASRKQGPSGRCLPAPLGTLSPG